MTNQSSELYANSLRRVADRLSFLPDKPEETPESTLHALWHAAAGTPRSAEMALAEPLPELDAAGCAQLEALLGKRLAGTPLAHLTQRQRFVEMEMLAGPEALVPRKETELLARAAIEIARGLAADRASIRVVDVCTGSGNVALAIATHVPAARVFAADLSEEAVSLARRNAAHLKLEDRAQFKAGDLLAPFDQAEFHGAVDLLTCNPPYISSAKVENMHGEISAHEPHLAFDGGPFGVAILMRLLQDAPRFVRPGGWLAFEVGLGQGPAMIKRLEKSGIYSQIRPLTDHAGAVRAMAARLAG
jgi:release factor glutamine methyltransferase